MSADLTLLQPEALQRAKQALAIAKYFQIEVVVTFVKRTGIAAAILAQCYDADLARQIFGKPHCGQDPPYRAGKNPHDYGLAFDSITVDPCQLDHWTTIRRQLGWVVHRKYPNHAEVPAYRDAIRMLQGGGPPP